MGYGYGASNVSYRRSYGGATAVPKTKKIDPALRQFLASARDPFLVGLYDQFQRRGLSERQIEIATSKFEADQQAKAEGRENPADVVAFLATVEDDESFLAQMKAKASYSILSENMVNSVRAQMDAQAKLATIDTTRLPETGKKHAFSGTVVDIKTKETEYGTRVYVRVKDPNIDVDVVVTMSAYSSAWKAAKEKMIPGNPVSFNAWTKGLYGASLYASTISKVAA